MTDYEVAERLEAIRLHLDAAFQCAGSSDCRMALRSADVTLRELKAALGHPRAGLSGDVSDHGKPLGAIQCQR